MQIIALLIVVAMIRTTLFEKALALHDLLRTNISLRLARPSCIYPLDNHTLGHALSLYPGIAIMLTALAFNLIGDGLRDRYQG